MSVDNTPDGLAANVRAARLDAATIARNFSDIHPPLGHSEALIEADRCYFCYDAPCTTACPTDIDIPAFIQKIRSGNIPGSAHTILAENIMGGMCARVCPTEILCEEACVRNTHEDKPVEIGLLQRHATDPVFADNIQLFKRAPSSGRTVAVVGGGPAGLSCAHRLSMLGHDVVLYNRDPRLGGLNEYGIAAYKAVDQFARREIDWILSIGGIEVINNSALGDEVHLADLQQRFDAVFLGVGLGSVNELRLENEQVPAVQNAIEYIAGLRQCDDLSQLPVGDRIIVIGGGMTAIDVAVQSKRLGAQSVDIVYRRGAEQMGASEHEQKLAQTSGVNIRHWAMPVDIKPDDGETVVTFEKTRQGQNGQLTGTGEKFELTADVIFKAIGQKLAGGALARELEGLDMTHGRIVVDANQATSVEGVWAGGDCVLVGDDLTVSAVQHGKIAAMAINAALLQKTSQGESNG